jgi:bacterial/archaeal transporter family-2 protein
MPANPIPLLLAVFAGVLLALQAPANAILAKASGSSVLAAFISFCIGTLALGTIVLTTSGRFFAPALKYVPWHAWLGGFYGAAFVAIAAYAASRIGIGVLLSAAIAGQLVAAVIIDHYGFFGLDRQPVSLAKIGGICLVLAGAVLLKKG